MHTSLNSLLLGASFASDGLPAVDPDAVLSDADSVDSATSVHFGDFGPSRRSHAWDDEFCVSEFPRMMHDASAYRQEIDTRLRQLGIQISEFESKYQNVLKKTDEIGPVRDTAITNKTSIKRQGERLDEMENTLTEHRRKIDSLGGEVSEQISASNRGVLAELEDRCQASRAETRSDTEGMLNSFRKAVVERFSKIESNVLQLTHVLAPTEADGSSKKNPSITGTENRLQVFIQQSDLNKARIAAFEAFLGDPMNLTTHDVFRDLLPSAPGSPLNFTDLITHLGAKVVEITHTFDENVHGVVDSEFTKVFGRISENVSRIQENASRISELSDVLGLITPEDVEHLKAIEQLVRDSVNAKVDDEETSKRMIIQFRTLIGQEVEALIGNVQSRLAECEGKVAEVSSLSQSIHDLQTLVTSHGTQLSTIQTGIANFNSTISSVQGALSSRIDSIVLDSANQMGTLNGHITSIKERLKTLEETHPQTSSAPDQGNSDLVASVNRDISALSTTVDTFKEQLNLQIQQLDQRVTTEINQEESAREAFAVRTASDLAEIRSLISATDANFEALRAEDQEIHRLISSVQSDQNDTNVNVAGLAQRIGGVEDTIGQGERGKTLLTQIAELESAIESVNSRLSAQEAGDSSRDQFISSEISSTKAEISESMSSLELRLSERVTALESQKFDESIATLNTAASQGRERQAVADEKIGNIESGLSELKTKVDEDDGEIKASVQNLGDSVDSRIQEIRARLGAFDGETPTVLSQINDLNSAVSGNKSQSEEAIGAVASELADLKASYDTLLGKVESIEGIDFVDTMNKQITDTKNFLTAKLNALKLELSGDISSASSQSNNDLMANVNELLAQQNIKLEAAATNDAMTDSIQALREELSELINSTKDELQGSTYDVDGRITTVDGRVTTVDGRITTVDGRVTTLSNKVAEDIDALKDELLAKIAEEKGDVETQITNNADGINALITEKEEQLQARIQSEETFSAQQRAALLAQIGDVEGRFNASIAELDDKITEARNDTATVDGRLGTLNTQVGQLKTTVDTQAGTLTALQNSLTAIQAQVGTLESYNIQSVLDQLQDGSSESDNLLQSVQQLLQTQNNAIQSIQSSITAISSDLVAVQTMAVSTKNELTSFLLKYNGTSYNFGDYSAGRA
jgi:chromosome segregation ATPase